MVSVPLSVERPGECEAVNIKGTQHVLEAARVAGVRVLLAASAAAYGNTPRLPARKSTLPTAGLRMPRARSPESFSWPRTRRSYGISTVGLRYFNIFGPRRTPRAPTRPPSRPSSIAYRQAQAHLGDGTQTRDFTPITDVVRANLLAAASPEPLAGEVFNVGTGRRVSLMDVLSALQSLTGQDMTPTLAPPRAGDVQHSVADITRAPPHAGVRTDGRVRGRSEGHRRLGPRVSLRLDRPPYHRRSQSSSFPRTRSRPSVLDSS